MKELCQSCVWATHPQMLTGYCLVGRCDGCGRVTELAVIQQQPKRQPRLPLEQKEE